MTDEPLDRLRSILKHVEAAIFGQDISHKFEGLPNDAWAGLKPTKRGLEWNDQGDLVAVEWRTDEASGLTIKRKRRIK